jgi:CBS domain-containing protein
MSTRPIRQVIQDRKPVTVSKTASVREAAKLMANERVGALLVVESGRLIGIFTERDALFRVLARGLDPDRIPIAEVMTGNLMTIPPDRPLGHALHIMFEGGFRHVPVVEDGRAVGIVSARDALGAELVEFEGELRYRDEIAERMR